VMVKPTNPANKMGLRPTRSESTPQTGANSTGPTL
jgi:hypothetical protein